MKRLSKVLQKGFSGVKREFATKAPPRLFGDAGVSKRGVITTIDAHCCGLPARVVVDGLPEVPGDSAMEKRKYMMENLDWARTLLITEPRGYPCQNVDYILPKTKACPEAEYSYVVGENNFVYPAMSGHNTICVVTALLETGLVEMKEPVTEFVLEAPAGPIKIRAECRDGKCESVTFTNTPSFARQEDLGVVLDVPGGVGKVEVDIAYGGMWYAIVDGPSLGLQVTPEEASDLARLGEMIKIAAREQHPVQHPTIDYPGCDIIAIRGPPSAEGVERYGAHARNAVIMSTNELDWNKPGTWKGNIDRSPCGSGTSAIMAAMHARGQIGINEDFVHESVLGGVFTGRLVDETTITDGKKVSQKAVVPAITGQAWITQHSKVVVDPTDPFPDGYTLGDIW